MADEDTVFVVEDDATTRDILETIVANEGFEVLTFADAASVRQALKERAPDIVCLDLGLPDEDGLSLLTYLHRVLAGLPIIVITAQDDVSVVVEAMKLGAFDYIEKPPQPVRLRTALQSAVDHLELAATVRRLQRVHEHRFDGIVSASEQMEDLLSQIDRLAMSDVSTFIHGETGTGKELIARALHDHSGRADGPFIAVNCAAISSSLQQSELFGHEKGAFTGASEQHQGHFERADSGTLFLDEVAELNSETQAAMLRVLQEGQFQRVGGSRTVESDFRLVTASHKSLRDEVESGNFREDLMFRVKVFDVEVPALRERPSDIPVLIEHFVDEINEDQQRSLSVSEGAWRALEAHDWPGNVRELRNALERAAVVATDTIELEHLPGDIREGVTDNEPSPSPKTGNSRVKTLAQLEEEAIQHAVDTLGDKPTQLAEALGISRATLYRKFKEYDIDRDAAQ